MLKRGCPDVVGLSLMNSRSQIKRFTQSKVEFPPPPVWLRESNASRKWDLKKYL